MSHLLVLVVKLLEDFRTHVRHTHSIPGCQRSEASRGTLLLRSPSSLSLSPVQVPRVKLVSLAWLEVLEFLEPKASKDSWVLLALKDNRAYLALLVIPWRDPKETEDLRVNLAFQVRAFEICMLKLTAQNCTLGSAELALVASFLLY